MARIAHNRRANHNSFQMMTTVPHLSTVKYKGHYYTSNARSANRALRALGIFAESAIPSAPCAQVTTNFKNIIYQMMSQQMITVPHFRPLPYTGQIKLTRIMREAHVGRSAHRDWRDSHILEHIKRRAKHNADQMTCRARSAPCATQQPKRHN